MQVTSDTTTTILPALLAARKEFGRVVKNQENDFFNSSYANLATVLGAVESALMAQDVLLIQPTYVGEDGKNILTTILAHVDGEFVRSEYRLNPVKNDPQSEGSALTYARRYQVMTMLGLAPEDDDGNEASTQAPPPPPREWVKEAQNITSVEELTKLAKECMAAGQLAGQVKERLTARKTFLELHDQEQAAKNLADGGLTEGDTDPVGDGGGK